MFRSLLSDPIVRFFLGGAFIFITYTVFADGEQNRSYLISFNNGRIERLKSAWQKEKGRLPSEATLNRLIQSEIEQEIIFREAQILGLDKDDRVIRRRLVQKYRFMLDDAVIVPKPDIQDQKAYYQLHLAQYREPGQLSFEHLFFSNAGRVDPQGDAATALLKYNRRTAKEAGQLLGGDSFMGPTNLESYQKQMVRRIFGAGFFDHLMALQLKQWSIPIESAFGWHLVYVHHRADSRQLSFQESQEEVLKDVYQLKRKVAKQDMLNKMISKYKIETPAGVPAVDMSAIARP